MVWLSKPLGASGAVFEDMAQPSNTKPRTKRAAENIVAFFIRFSSAKREYYQQNVLSHSTPLVGGRKYLHYRAWVPEAQRPPASRRPLRCFLFCVLLSSVLRLRRLQLLLTYYTKRPSQITVRTGGEEELVGPAVVCRSSAEFNPPELVDDDVLAVRVPDRAHKLATKETKCVDGAVVSVVRNQQSVAQFAKV